MLRYRLFFGTVMTVLFTGIVIVDGWLDGSLTRSVPDDKVQGTITCILAALLLIPAHREMARLAAARNLELFLPISTIASIAFATSWYWSRLIQASPLMYICSLSAFFLLALFVYQYVRFGIVGVMANCGVNCLSVMYLGVLASFVPAIRIDFGPWALLLYVFVVKSADIGAYAIGSLFGRHKFAPSISPNKSWEGMMGAAASAIIIAVVLGGFFGIMHWMPAVIFGVCFAFIGQLGDLAESMLKRDALQKDSANNIPGFGGVLDIIDSPLAAAPFAYLFFLFSIGR